MSHLFSKAVLADATRYVTIPDLESKITILRWWLDMYDTGSLQKKSEKEFEGVYNESLFGTILGYTSIVSGEYTREKEPRNESNGQKPDIGLGFYSPTIATTQAVVELKDAATSLDRPQQRAGNLTPIQQAFKYKPLYNSKWVIVSNFFEIRLYTDTYQDYESFTLRELVNPADDYSIFRRFYTIFHASRLTSKSGESETERLLARVRIEEEKISKEFYKEYKSLRLELMRDIWKHNPESQNADVIEQSQRIIDRIVFICFCEDRGLIPQNELSYRVDQAKTFGFAPWEMLKKFFISIDSGDVSLGIPDGYNGGLFRPDASIDALRISDSIIERFVALGRYDFSEDGGQLSVEILGHIFEQSISDIEEIRSKIETSGKVDEELPTDKKISKRKKDGIFYTPAYIVNYIVENSLGKYMSEHEETLKDRYALKSDINEKNYRKREIDAYTEYQKILQNVKVLDPACGSGAFLVRVFDWLLAENQRVANILYAEWDQIRMWDHEDYFREILRNNIYGVDLNEESVEITKLSLWLKSAVRGKKLVTLDNNIKCGNSLIDDPSVAWDKAFNWNTEFADIMISGGFDVIVGNPPYVTLGLGKKQESINENTINFYKKTYSSSIEYKWNLFALFTDKWISLLSKNGKMSYIVPNTLLLNLSFSKIREHILTSSFLYKIINLRYQVFSDAETGWCTIFWLSKHLSKWDVQIAEIWTENDFLRHAYNKVSYESLLKSPWFRFYTNTDNLSFITRIFTSWFPKLREIWDFYNGIKTGNNDKFLSENKEDERYIPVFRWRDIDRYLTKKSVMYVLFDPKQLWSNTDENKLSKNPKILIRQTGDSITATYDENWNYPMDTLHSFFDSKTNLKYLLAVINSQIFNKVFQIFVDEWEKVFAEVKIAILKELPLPIADDQKLFIEWTEKMLSLNRELYEKSEGFIKNISAKYKIEKITRKLEKWWELDFALFVRELKVKIWLEEQEELMTYFDKRKAEVCDIVAKIETTDKEIDEMVFELYGLSDEEKRVVLESNGK
jgi:hypothetical protein